MSQRIRSVLVASLLVLLPAAAALAVGEGRLQATVVDEQGNPVPNAQVRVINDDIAFEKTLETNKRGAFTLMVIDATRVYDFELAKEGHQTTRFQHKMKPGAPNRETFTLPTQGAAPAAGGAQAGGGSKAVNTFNEGVAAAQADDMATAEAKFLEASEIDPKMQEPWGALASLYFDRGDHAKALAMADKLLELDDDNMRALQMKYDIYVASGDEAQAQAMLDRLSAVEGGGAAAAINVFNQGADAARVGDLRTAERLFARSVELDPELAAGHAAMARIHLAAERWEEAVKAAETALDLEPGRVEVQRVRYEGYRRMGQADKAQEVFEEMAAADPDGLAQTLLERGEESFNAGDMKGAQVALEQALQAKPDTARAHYLLGLSYANGGDNAKAKQHLQRFLELAPDHPEAGTAKEMIAYLG
ncbi:MAG TPA: tetratricopeptide repeat protein [Thermoanaerobaculia bacterium]|nr:tetratricopeptide repeat protein [Thermoanaerobaculia bacterium]